MGHLFVSSVGPPALPGLQEVASSEKVLVGSTKRAGESQHGLLGLQGSMGKGEARGIPTANLADISLLPQRRTCCVVTEPMRKYKVREYSSLLRPQSRTC